MLWEQRGLGQDRVVFDNRGGCEMRQMHLAAMSPTLTSDSFDLRVSCATEG